MTRLPGFLLLGILMVALVAAVVWSICMVPIKADATRAALADLRIHYQRRADLAPSLLASASVPADEAALVRVGVMQAHSVARASNVDSAALDDPSALAAYLAAQRRLSNALDELLTVTEAYPQLKSDQTFLGLKRELQDVDSRILLAEQKFDETARAYNTELQTFPGVIWVATIFRSARPVPLVNPEQEPVAALPALRPATALVSVPMQLALSVTPALRPAYATCSKQATPTR